MKITCISDTHTLHDQVHLPGGDLLLCAGDICSRGGLSEVARFSSWLARQSYERKVVVAGNHDWALFRDESRGAAEEMLWSVCTYLRDSSTVFRGWKIYGSPWQPEFHDWAFNLPRCGPELADKWARISDDTQILVTHGPPHGIRDKTVQRRAGCELLRDRLPQLTQLRLHVFGHIHEGYGWLHNDSPRVSYANASVCNLRYEPVNAPLQWQLPDRPKRRDV